MQLLSLFIMGGFGHIKPAEALVEQFAKKNIKGRAYDVFSPDGSPLREAATIYNTISRSPVLSPVWNLITRHDLLPAWLFQPAHWLELSQNRSAITRLKKKFGHKKDLIVTATHWTPALLAAHAFPDKTIFLYVTDIHPHGLWKITPPNIHYLVPMEETKIDIARYGIPNHRITICPFPIHQEILTRQKQRFSHRLTVFKRKNPKNTDVLVISGGAGTGRQEMLRLLDSFSLPARTRQIRLTFLVSTSTLYHAITKHCHNCKISQKQFSIDYYTPHSLYRALQKTEILVTKAGGDITFEALAEGLPIYTLKDVGDHERLNRQYLELIGAAKPLFHTQAPWDLIQSDILTEEIILMTRAANQHGKFHRQTTTPDTILNVLSAKS